MHWYMEALRKYATFSGRARRLEYWMFSLIHTAILLVMVAVSPRTNGFAMIPVVYCLATFLPSLAVTVRRFHDSGHSAAWLLAMFIPVAGGIAFLILALLNGQRGPNQYGPDPKYHLPGGRPLSPTARGA